MKKYNNEYKSTIIVGLVASIITILSLLVSVFVLLDKKKKKEDRELEEYLDSTIQ